MPAEFPVPEKRVVRVLFTGGAHGGKTSTIGIVKKTYEEKGWRVVVLDESATDFIQTLGSGAVDTLQGMGMRGMLFFQKNPFRLRRMCLPSERLRIVIQKVVLRLFFLENLRP